MGSSDEWRREAKVEKEDWTMTDDFHCPNCCPEKKKGHHKWLERIIEAALVTLTTTIVVLILKFLGL